MHSKKNNLFVQWWMTPKLPAYDIYELPLLKNNNWLGVLTHLLSKWFIHPLKRRLARFYLKFLQSTGDIKVIGVTGSAGKSTTSQMLYSILKLDGKAVVTKPSIDSVYNIPNTILKCSLFTRYLILEMSVEYPGEMDYYLWLAKLNVGVITNIFPSHLEFLKNVSGVLKEKGKLVESLGKDGIAILNDRDQNLKLLARNIKSRVVWFKGDGDLVQQNMAAAKKVSKSLGIKEELIKKGFNNYEKPKHRLELLEMGNDIRVLDDSYNSNPKAAIATIKYFNKIAKGAKIAIIGDMLELGSFEEEGHRMVGRELAKNNFDIVIGVGKSIRFLIDEIEKSSKKVVTYEVNSANDAVKILKSILKKDSSVLIKGSRSIGLDKIVSELH